MANELVNQNMDLATPNPDDTIYGFEDARKEDLVIPRIKAVNALSPERTEGIAKEGDLINSLTKEDMTNKLFVPIKQYYTNIEWNPDRKADQRIFCRSLDGNIGANNDGTRVCAQCKRNQFDNTKTGKAAQPSCTQYMNFLGFFEGDAMPVVLSFARTNYNEGKKMLSIARSMRTSIWNYNYKLSCKKVSKDKDTWYIVVSDLNEATTPETRALALELYKAYCNTTVNADYEEGYSAEPNIDITATEV